MASERTEKGSNDEFILRQGVPASKGTAMFVAAELFRWRKMVTDRSDSLRRFLPWSASKAAEYVSLANFWRSVNAPLLMPIVCTQKHQCTLPCYKDCNRQYQVFTTECHYTLFYTIFSIEELQFPFRPAMGRQIKYKRFPCDELLCDEIISSHA